MDANSTNNTHRATPPAPKQSRLTPAKYIRTFESDRAAAEKGSFPDLVPLKTSTHAEQKQVESTPPVLPPLIPKKPDISPASPSSQTPQPSALPQSIPTPSPAPQAVNAADRVAGSPLETYRSDFLDRMKETNASTATVLAAEEDAQQTPPPAPEEKTAPSHKNIAYAAIGIVLCIAGAIGAYIAYTYHTGQSALSVIAPTVPAPIFVEEREQISGSGTALLQSIEQSVTRPLTEGTVRQLYTTDATSTDNTIFLSLPLSAPDMLLRNIVPGEGMAGVINTSSGQSPFFILSVSLYSETFSGMLSWESRMLSNMSALFPPYTESSSVATSTSSSSMATSTSTAPTAPGFRDEVVDNHDARVYRDSAGRSVIVYGYWNEHTLVIARDPAAFTEILSRLALTHTGT